MTVGRNTFALIRRAAWPAAGLLIICYFVGAAVVGENGVMAWGDYRRAKTERGATLARLEILAATGALRHRVGPSQTGRGKGGPTGLSQPSLAAG